MLSPDEFRHRAAAAHEPLRTFHPRRVGLGPARQAALQRLFPVMGFSVHDQAAPFPRTPEGLLDAVALFGRRAPLVLEIGPGMGEATAAMAAADPDRDWLAVEAHLPGVASLLLLLHEAGLTNVRVGHGDALELVRLSIAPDSLDAVHAFFPDPWPKTRHHKRRLIQPAHVALLRSRLVVGGLLHVATDWPDYAEQMAVVLSADPGLQSATNSKEAGAGPAEPAPTGTTAGAAAHASTSASAAAHASTSAGAAAPTSTSASAAAPTNTSASAAMSRDDTRPGGESATPHDTGLRPVMAARPTTAFERKALAQGRVAHDFVFRRTR